MSALQLCLINLHREMGHALKALEYVVSVWKHLEASTRLWRCMKGEIQFHWIYTSIARMTVYSWYLTTKYLIKALRALWYLIHVTNQIHNSIDIQKCILFVISLWDQFKISIRFSIFGCLSDLDNASLSKWRHEKKVRLIFKY